MPTPSRPEHSSEICTAKRPVLSTMLVVSAVSVGTNGASNRLARSKVRAAVGSHSFWVDCIAPVPSSAAIIAYHQMEPRARAASSHKDQGDIASNAVSVAAMPTTDHSAATTANDRSLAVYRYKR